jgi:hypothetical protein
LTRQKAQIETTFIRTASRALVRGFVLLLLFTNQFWAGIICGCNLPDGSGHACCRRAQHDNPPVDREGLHTQSSHCASPKAMVFGAQFDYSPQGVKVCCRPVQEDGTQAVIMSSTEQLPANNHLPAVHIDAHTIIAPASVYTHPQRRNRPLYLAFSCWLI